MDIFLAPVFVDDRRIVIDEEADNSPDDQFLFFAGPACAAPARFMTATAANTPARMKFFKDIGSPIQLTIEMQLSSAVSDRRDEPPQILRP
ncbi:hypothetical protein LZK82_26115 (plasmid) [Rhizobium leguminosarum]|nr:hypothetical protein LZK82_26115 [Rhizobium leguminosarum]